MDVGSADGGCHFVTAFLFDFKKTFPVIAFAAVYPFLA